MPAGVDYCTLGAVIDHELTHSLDSFGRLFAPSRNHPGFDDAFGIRAGDEMWIDPKERVTMW